MTAIAKQVDLKDANVQAILDILKAKAKTEFNIKGNVLFKTESVHDFLDAINHASAETAVLTTVKGHKLNAGAICQELYDSVNFGEIADCCGTTTIYGFEEIKEEWNEGEVELLLRIIELEEGMSLLEQKESEDLRNHDNFGKLLSFIQYEGSVFVNVATRLGWERKESWVNVNSGNSLVMLTKLVTIENG